MRRLAWKTTPIGDPAGWAPTLRVFVRFMLMARDPVFITWGRRSTFLYNDAAARLALGHRHPDALGRAARDVWGERWAEIRASARRRGNVGSRHPVRLPVDGRGDVFLSFSCTPLRDETRSERGGLWIVVDETAAVLAAAAGDRSQGDGQTMANERLATVAHRLRTPVNTVLAWAQLLAGRAQSEEQRHGLNAIERSARAQVHLLEELTLADDSPATSDGLHTDSPVVANPRGSSVDLSRVSIMVVDDDPDARETAAGILGEAGAEVRIACSADQALAATESVMPDVIVSDITMPVVNGYEFIRQVRARGGAHARVPAIALTSLAAARDRQSAYLAGFQMHVAKPVDSGELLAAVARLTGRLS